MVSELGLAGPWCLRAGSSQELADKGCACCCWDTLEPREAQPSCSLAMALIFTKGLCCLCGSVVSVFGQAWGLGAGAD